MRMNRRTVFLLLLTAGLCLIQRPVIAELYYPSVIGSWLNGPLTPAALPEPEPERTVGDEQLQMLKKLFRRQTSPKVRARMAWELRNAGTPAAFRLLTRLLKNEQDSAVQEKLFRSLLHLQQQGFAVSGGDSWLPEWFSARVPELRSASMVLYLTCARNPDPVPVIQALYRESSPQVLTPVGRILQPRAMEISRSLLSNLYVCAEPGNTALRIFAIGLLARQPNPDSAILLRDAVQDSDPAVRIALAQGLAAHSAGPVELLKRTAADPLPAVRLASAQIRKPDAGREELLAYLLADPVPQVRAAAAESLGTAGTLTASAVLAEQIADSRVRENGRSGVHLVRRAVAKALEGAVLSPEIGGELTASAGHVPEIRPLVIPLLLRSGVPSAMTSVLRWLKDSEEVSLQKAALSAVRETKYAPALPELVRLSGSADPEVRRLAAETLGLFRTDSAAQALKKLFYDRDPAVSEAAVQAMYRSGNPVFLPEYRHALADRSPEGAVLRAVACRAVSALDAADKRILADLETLAAEPCIPYPGKDAAAADADFVRLSALLTLLEAARNGNREASKIYDRSMRLLKQLPAGQTSPAFREYLRQVDAFARNQPVECGRLPAVPVSFSIPQKGLQ